MNSNLWSDQDRFITSTKQFPWLTIDKLCQTVIIVKWRDQIFLGPGVESKTYLNSSLQASLKTEIPPLFQGGLSRFFLGSR